MCNGQGATLEIQRTQHAEAVEQQLLRARARQFNVVSIYLMMSLSILM